MAAVRTHAERTSLLVSLSSIPAAADLIGYLHGRRRNPFLTAPTGQSGPVSGQSTKRHAAEAFECPQSIVGSYRVTTLRDIDTRRESEPGPSSMKARNGRCARTPMA